MPKQRIAIIVLAAGASTRMGTPKQLIKIASTSLIRLAAQEAIKCDRGPVIVVLGANKDLIRPELEGLGVFITENPDWKLGMSGSIHSGLKKLHAIGSEIEGVILMPADQPRVTCHSLEKIIQAHELSQSGIVAARFNDVLGTPAFFSCDYFKELLQLKGKGGAQSLLEKHRAEVMPLPLPEAAQDLDTPEDLIAFQKNLPIGQPESASRKNQSGVTPIKGFKIESVDDSAILKKETASGQTRRQFITNVTVAGAGVVVAPALVQSLHGAEPVTRAMAFSEIGQTIAVTFHVNGVEKQLQLDPRVTLLDVLRERLDLTGSKKGCDHGQCGACTILVNGRRINACLALAVVHDGDEITTIEGLANGNELHPVQEAFLENDGFQCGYCTPGQICSAVALLKENHANDDAEIREWMSGNICRCGAYPNIVAAIREAKSKTPGKV